MGALYDLENIKSNPRCRDIKGAIIIINLIGAICSLFTLIIIQAIDLKKNKKKAFLSKIITFIFFSEIVNSFSKLLQLLKYAFKDTRMNNDINEKETPRGIICQIQIVTSIIADVWTLLGTLLLSYRSYEVIRGERKIFERKIEQKLSFVIIIVTSVIFSITFLFIDKIMTEDSITYKFDLRDRCTYWCWLDHVSSIICHIFYLVPLVINIIYAIKIYKALTESFSQISGKNENDDNYLDLEDDDRTKLNEIKIMQIKYLAYVVMIIIIWIPLLMYRFFDDIAMINIDKVNDRDKGEDYEVEYFNDHPGLRIFYEITFIFHTLISSFRGLLYGITFLSFEEKCCFNRKLFRKCFCCCNELYLKIPRPEVLDGNNNEIIRESSASDNLLENNITEGGPINKEEANK